MPAPTLMLPAIALAALLLGACSRPQPLQPPAGPVSDAVRRAHAESTASLDLADRTAFEEARRGFIAAPTGRVEDAAGRVVWDFDAFRFVDGDPPPTVHPTLWRQARLNNQVGLYRVADRVWQLRGFDLANLTLIEGRTGWIVIDALTTRETAAAAMAFARRHLGDRPVSALVYTHSHVDHFGGALGVIPAEEAAARRVPVVAPAGFMLEATRENLMVGVAMARRAGYMYGSRLAPGPAGLVDNGLGKAVAQGSITLLPPTMTVEGATERIELDGVEFVFHNVPDSEAPSEFVFAVPALRVFCGADLTAHSMHNLYTLRGAQVRDALKWAAHLDSAIGWAREADVIFSQHHWPVWGAERIRDWIATQRDVYRYIHDQTVRQINAGRTAAEIAESLRLPPALDGALAVRGYYGTVRHNVKGVFQHYLGWFDAHPSNLDPLPPLEAARRYVALAGGIDALVAAAGKAFDAGEFRWAAELLRHAVLAEPKHAAATELLARSFEQLGYAAEATPWRNFYLTGALEARGGPPQRGIDASVALDLLRHVPIERFLESMAASIDGPKAAETRYTINLVFTDLDETWVLRTVNGVLYHRREPAAADAQATLRLTRGFFVRMMTGQAGALALLTSGETAIEGSRIDLGRFLSLLGRAPGTFPIVTR